MANAPLLTLASYITRVEEVDYWPDDETPYANYPCAWRVVFQVSPQFHSDPATGMAYDGLNISIGDWFSNVTGGIAWRIKTIEVPDNYVTTCIIEDVDQYNTYADATQSGNGTPQLYLSGFIFTLDAVSQPITAPFPGQIDAQWQADLISRFWYTLPSGGSGGGGGPPPATELPLGDGTAAVGDSLRYAREDHVHPLAMTIDGGMF